MRKLIGIAPVALLFFSAIGSALAGSPDGRIPNQYIVQLREQLKQQQGDTFQLKAFHDLVLGAGPMPLPVLEARVLGK